MNAKRQLSSQESKRHDLRNYYKHKDRSKLPDGKKNSASSEPFRWPTKLTRIVRAVEARSVQIYKYGRQHGSATAIACSCGCNVASHVVCRGLGALLWWPPTRCSGYWPPELRWEPC